MTDLSTPMLITTVGSTARMVIMPMSVRYGRNDEKFASHV